MRGKTAVDCGAQMAWHDADILVANLACGASPATDPRIDRDRGTRFCIRIRPHAFDHASDFMTKRKWQRAARAHVQFFVFTEQKETVLHMQIGMADAATNDAH